MCPYFKIQILPEVLIMMTTIYNQHHKQRPAQENHNDADSKESKAHAAHSFVSACFVFSCPVEVLRHDTFGT